MVLTESAFRFSLLISQLLAKAIPVRGAKFPLSCILANTSSYLFLTDINIHTLKPSDKYSHVLSLLTRQPASRSRPSPAYCCVMLSPLRRGFYWHIARDHDIDGQDGWQGEVAPDQTTSRAGCCLADKHGDMHPAVAAPAPAM